jgi:hypothetical protein
MIQFDTRHRVRGGLLVLLAGAAVALGAVACADADANGSADPTASTTTSPTATATVPVSESPSTGTSTPGGSDGATPGPTSPTQSPDTPVGSTPGGGSRPNPGPTVVPIDPGYPIVQTPAPIESVDILVMESFPPQYGVHIVSGLPSGCASFAGAEVIERSGTTVRIEVRNYMPAPDVNVACTMIYGYHESNISLGSAFESGVTYTVDVNGTVTEFTAQ